MAKKKQTRNYLPGLITVIIALVVLLLIGYKHSLISPLNFQTTEEMPDGVLKVFDNDVTKLMHNTEITVPGTKQTVSLVNGKAEFSEDGGKGSIVMGDVFRVVKLGNNDYSVFGIVTVNYGGSGEFVYVVLYHATQQLFQNTDSSVVGDRVIVNSLSQLTKVANNTFTLGVNYLDRGPNAPMAETPTIKNVLKLEVKDNKFTSD